MPNGDATAVAEATVQRSTYFPQFARFRLTDIVRQQRDKEYADSVLAIGEDRVARDEDNLITVNHVAATPDEAAAIKWVFSDDLLLNNPEECGKRAILCPTNKAVDAINDSILERLPGDTRTLVGRTVLREDPYDNANPFAAPELLDGLHHSGVPPTTLRLKVGTLCMTVRNLSSEDALMNATRVVSRPSKSTTDEFQTR